MSENEVDLILQLKTLRVEEQRILELLVEAREREPTNRARNSPTTETNRGNTNFFRVGD